jgi:AcrR family transcriptional regulator
MFLNYLTARFVVVPTARATPARSDSRLTRDRLVEGVAGYIAEHGCEPMRMVDVAHHAGVSQATAYRYFESLDQLVRAHVLQLPEHAAARFAQGDRPDHVPFERFRRWNAAWVGACLHYGPTAVHLRSPQGFLARRHNGDPAVLWVCEHVEPLLHDLVEDPVTVLMVWNAVSDPREVLDLHRTLRWSATRIANFVTDLTLAVR